jgi:NADH:ubiquinone oxidoreductase subunit 4 (subunit M)
MSLVLILLPIVAGCALFFVPRTDRTVSRVVGCIVAAITFVLPLLGTDGSFSAHWLSRPFSASLHFAWGGLSFWIVLLLALCTFCAILATNMQQTRTMVALLLMLEGKLS